MPPTARRIWLSLMLALPLLSSGCVSRRLTVRSNPPGALVEVDGERIGLTPASMDFTYYGTREVTVSHPGYETKTIQQPVNPPFYQVFPLDFISNHFLPFHVTDRHEINVHLEPKRIRIDDDAELINRGRNIRSQAEVGRVP